MEKDVWEGCPGLAAACGGTLMAWGAFWSTKVLEFTPKVPGLAAVPGKRIWHLVVHIFGFALLGAGGVPAELFELFDLRGVFKSLSSSLLRGR